MEIKTKSNLIIIGSLIIGIIIGSIVTVSILKPKSSNRVDWRKPGSYQKRMFEIIKPNETQKDSLAKVMKKYEEKMMRHHKTAMEEYRLKADSLRAELKRFLSDEQIEILEKYRKEKSERYKRRRDSDKKSNERGRE